MDLPIEHPWVREGGGRMRFGLGVSSRAPAAPWPKQRQIAQTAEQFGFDSLWAPDHPAYIMDCYSTLAAFAAITERVRLGTVVCCVLHRSPAMLARVAADVDRISGGRLILGIGAGWNEREFARFDLPFPPTRERLRAVPRTLRRVLREWRDEPFRDDHETGKLLGGLGAPPVQRPRVPVMIGGRGEQVTLRQVARYADMSNFDGPEPDELRHKFSVLRAHCEDLGRPYESILRSVLRNACVLAPTAERVEAKVAALPPVYDNVSRANIGTPAQLIEHMREVIAAGVRYMMFNLTTWDDLETLELLGREVLPALQDGGPGLVRRRERDAPAPPCPSRAPTA